MPRRKLQFVLMGVIVMLACLSLDWALGPFFSPPQGLYDGNEAHLIASRYPHHLIDPAWVDSNTFFWGQWEMFARLAVVAVGTLGLFLCSCVITATVTTGLRGNLRVLLLAPGATPVFFGLLEFLVHGERNPVPSVVRLAFFPSLFLFVIMAVVQFIAWQFARREHHRLMLAYCCSLLIFAGCYAVVTYLGRVAVPIPPPNVVYMGGPTNAAWDAFLIVAWPGLFLLAPMAAASWPFLRGKNSVA